MSIHIVRAIFINHAKDTKKNRKSMLMFVLMPVIAYLMNLAMGDITHEEQLVMTYMFLGMHCTIIPIISAATGMAEDKEKNTFRTLIMNGVTSGEYLLGMSIFTILVTVLSSSLFVLIAYDLSVIGVMYLSAFICSVISVMIGLTIGTFAQNVTSASSMTIVIGLPLALLTAYSNLNDSLAKVAQYLYNKQAQNLLFYKDGEFSRTSVLIICCNLLVIIVLFLYADRKTKFAD